LGLYALCWAWIALPELGTASKFANVSTRIIAGETFSQDELARQVEAFTVTATLPISYARIQGAGSTLQLRTLEIAMENADPKDLDARMATLARSLRGALAGSPSDSLVWTFLYWLESMRGGQSDRTLDYLTLSYIVGPFEGAVAIRRNRLALSSFDKVDGVTQEKIVSEFAAMLNSRFIDTAASNFVGPGWPLRERLLENLDDVDPAAKQVFAKHLYNLGLKINSTNLPNFGDRPWR
jgi:hypothetical protein